MSEETKQPTGEETPETQAGAEQEAPQTEAPETEKKEEKAAKGKKKKELVEHCDSFGYDELNYVRPHIDFK